MSDSMRGANSTDPANALAAAQAFMRDQRWAEAAAELTAIVQDQPAVGLQLNVCRNLDALQRRRPEVYRAVLAATGPERYTIRTAACGHPTVFARTGAASLTSLSPANKPVASLTSTFAQIKAPYQAGKPMAILGIGDGYLLKSCSLHPPKMLFDAQQPVYLFEPDGQNVLACLTLHDYTGENGPIEHGRFQWFVGPDYMEQARACLIGEPFHAPPAFDVSQGLAGDQISAAVRGLLQDFLAVHNALQQRVNAYYAAGFSRDGLIDALADRPSRQPRVLLITTRLSSVLQYSTRDAAEGFRANGWDARVFIEPEPHHAPTLTKLLQVIEQFKPDLMFQLDHLRSEWRGAIPPQLPFACWIQDHLSNLTNRQAGAAMTDRDFVLVGMPAMYVERYGYPARQCIELTKLTRVPQRPATWKSDGDDLVYVSSASQQPEELAAKLTEQFDHSPELGRLVSAACADQIDRYRRGETLPTLPAVRQAFEQLEASLGMELDHPEMREKVLDALFDRMSNLLYRQQGLRWAAAVAARQKLKLSIYGPGWDKHAEFALFARGVVKYGPDLEELTRRSKINLALEPFLSVSHQRLLDGLVAGGFFLTRDHPSNTLFPELLEFVVQHAPEAETVAELRRACADRGELAACEELLRRCERVSGYGDVLTMVRGGERAGVIPLGRPTLPSLSLISFASQDDLDGRVMAFLADEPSRRRTAERQRVSVEERLSYQAGMQRIVRRIHGLVTSERVAQAA